MVVNPNKRYPDKGEALRAAYHRLDAATHWLGEHMTRYMQLERGAHDAGHKLSREFVRDFKFEYHLEMGPTSHALHVDAVITMAHKTRLRLNYAGIRDYYKHTLGIPGLHVDFVVVSDPAVNFREYASKQGRTRTVTTLNLPAR